MRRQAQLLPIGNHVQPGQYSLAVACCLNGRNNLHLVRRYAPSAASLALSADKDIIDLPPCFLLALSLLVKHQLHQLVLDQPGTATADPKVAHELPD